MALFDELMTTRKMEDPEERKAAELERSKKKVGKRVKKRETSVTSTTYNVTMALITLLVFLIVASVVGYVIYLGVTEFIPPSE